MRQDVFVVQGGVEHVYIMLRRRFMYRYSYMANSTLVVYIHIIMRMVRWVCHACRETLSLQSSVSGVERVVVWRCFGAYIAVYDNTDFQQSLMWHKLIYT